MYGIVFTFNNVQTRAPKKYLLEINALSKAISQTNQTIKDLQL